MRIIKIRRGILFLIPGLLLGCALNSQVIPADDRDIDKIITEIGKTTYKIEGWNFMDCAEFDCAQMQQFHIRLRDAMTYMRYMHYWLQRATDAQMDHLMSISNETALATERAARVQKILAWQTYFHRLGTALLDLAGFASALDEIAKDPKLLESKSHGEMLELLDKFYEGMKDAESFENTLNQGLRDKEFPKPIADMMPSFAGLSSSDWNDMKSNISNLKSILDAANRYNNDWKKVLKEGRGFASAGQVIGRIVKSISEKEIADRSKLVDDLMRDIVSQDAVQAASFKDLQRRQLRRNKAEDAYLGLRRLIIVSGEEGILTKWLLRFNNRCSFDLGYTSKVVFPATVAVTDFNIVTETDKRRSWGQALLYLNPRMSHVLSLLGNLPTVSAVQPQLTLGKIRFEKGENMNVAFKAPVCLPALSWVGILKSNVPHNDEPLNSSSTIGEKSFLNRRQSGTMLFKAPQEEGYYELRMYDPDARKEITLLAFSVRKGADSVRKPVNAGLADWGTTAVKHRGKIGQRFTYTFPPGTSSATVWGSQIYTDDSPIALAAVHAGLINFQQGGTVTIEIRAGMSSYKGSKANGVTTSDYGSWSGSYVFVK